MKIAILSVSEKGKTLSNKLKSLLDKDSTIISVDIYYKNVKTNINKIFNEYDGIIGIMACGILIRSISPLINSKINDPAILNIDEYGKNVISLLSGHIGGANKLTRKVSFLLNANPIITTATDINNKLGIDVLASDIYYNILNPKDILYFNKMILKNEKLDVLINKEFNKDFLINYLKNITLEIDLSFTFNNTVPLNEIHISHKNKVLILKEKELIVGVGCKKGKSKKDILNGIEISLNRINLDISRINAIATAEIKKDEKGLIELIEDFNIPLYLVSINKLKLFKSKNISKSQFVKSKFGIDGVCEPSALIVAGFDSKLIYKKTVFNGVTIAIAISN